MSATRTREPSFGLASGRMRWLALMVLCSVHFVVVLDITIVNLALPSIRTSLGLDSGELSWVIGAYALVFAGFLLLGGRAADVLGSRRVFVLGLALFTFCSLLAGLAWSDGVLLAARAFQGLGAAFVSPAAFAILSTSYAEGGERNRALGVWASVGGLAAAAGAILGGGLTELLSWRWIFLANVPIGVLVLALAPFVLPGLRPATRRRFDLPGALLATGAVLALVHGISRASSEGASAAQVALPLVLAVLLAAALVAWERRAPDPLVPAAVLMVPQRLLANAAGFVHGAIMLGSFLLLALALQDTLGLSPIEAGLGLLTVRGTSIGWARLAPRAATRYGARPVLVVGMLAMTVAMLSFARVSPGGSYATELLPGLLVLGLAIPFLFVSCSILALEGARPADAGVVSGLLSTSQWTGGTVGLALVSALVATEGGPAAAGDLRAGFVACALLGGVGLLAAALLARPRPAPARGAGRCEPAATDTT